MLELDTFAQTPKLTATEQAAWDLYCNETAGDMDVKDFWWELSSHIQAHYLKKV